MACERCAPTCGDRTKWQTSGRCDCDCHEYGVDTYEPLNMMAAREGDRAIYGDDDGGYFAHQLLMWAVCRVRTEYRHPNRPWRVIRRDVRRVIAGMITSDVGVSCVEEASNFKGYATPSDTDETIREQFGLRAILPPPGTHA